MRGHIIAEERFLHQGVDHHLYVTASDRAEHEYRFEVRRIPAGGDHQETLFEKTKDLSEQLAHSPNTTMDQLIQVEMKAAKKAVFAEENLHANDP
jgi:hypothetical protein